jgi:hypothetical protein
MTAKYPISPATEWSVPCPAHSRSVLLSFAQFIAKT